MSTSFLDALQQQSSKLQNGKNEHEKKDIPRLNAGMYTQPLILDVLLVTGNVRDTIKLRFNRKPEKEILAKLKQFFWRYDAETREWENSDNNFNRKFLQSEFQAEIEILEEILVPAPAFEPAVSQEFEVYKRQVNALTAYFDLDPAELVIKAINCLYTETEPFLTD
jgi:hypothetical protein